MSRTFTLDSIHKTYISQISLFTFKKNAQPQVKKALSGVSITLTPGLYGLLGPNGAGKSTLIHIITGTLAPDSGEVLWCGKPAMGIAFRRILGYKEISAEQLSDIELHNTTKVSTPFSK